MASQWCSLSVFPQGMDSSESGGEAGDKVDKLDAIPQTVEEEFLQVSPPQSPSAPTIVAIEDPLHDALQDRLPSVLEAAIKAEPKVEVEPAPRIPTPTSAGAEDGVQARLGSCPESFSPARDIGVLTD